MTGSLIASGCAHDPGKPERKADIGFVEIDRDMSLRSMVVHNTAAKGTVLLLHGFPETVHAWQEIAIALGDDYEVHAFDWPGYGLSSRPAADRFAYAPRDYAHVLEQYIDKAGIDRSSLTIYATDIGALPALLLALEQPDIARTIIVGDFAPFDRPQYMYESLQNLKSAPTAEPTRAYMNEHRDEILANTFYRGLPEEARYAISPEFRDDMARGWSQGEMTSVDAFYHYYSHFTRDQQYFESNLARLKTPVKVVWGEKDLYIKQDMAVEFSQKANLPFAVLPGIGHYPHLQDRNRTIEEIRASFR
ncbi:alpha/beta hydrolase [Lysobacter sp. S4-A87]|uniref:alpha/beta fold hydrolase n=1 Tax=Lysobacter sp. S4-A87 TaxID=2925843 RepID=UPI001F52BAD5|nr:alpha/beta hydrolase [Lysobacter sp. S4-A87]UNK49032.1 alpha/beta hydrolase [Lysobacter sp. S4-A87]